MLFDRGVIYGEKSIKNNFLKTVLFKKDVNLIFNNFKLKLVVSKNQQYISNGKYEMINWSIIKDKTLKIRTWCKGDIFQPLGMKGHQKLSDFFINNKINQFLKETIPIMTADDNIVWVCGLRISDKVKLKDNTNEFAFLIWENIS